MFSTKFQIHLNSYYAQFEIYTISFCTLWLPVIKLAPSMRKDQVDEMTFQARFATASIQVF